MHYTATVDFDFVVGGSTTLVLESDEVALEPGDCVLIPGVPHAWRAGPDGCELCNVLIGKAIEESDGQTAFGTRADPKWAQPVSRSPAASTADSRTTSPP